MDWRPIVQKTPAIPHLTLDDAVMPSVFALHAALCYRGKTWLDALAALRACAAHDEPQRAPTQAAKLAREARVELDWSHAGRAQRWLAGSPARSVVLAGDPGFPPSLMAIPDPPGLLFVEGARDVLLAPQIAVVGSRAASAGALEFAFELARELVGLGLSVTSGLARGVDGAAHRGALQAGQTVAVLGCGPDRIYPPRHVGLAREIAARGALVTEFPVGAAPQNHHFPRRNRVISGLSCGVVVVEAGLSSGSLLTARAALEQGREVFAVPGAVRNPQARGCHMLIREGAHLTEGVADILQGLPKHILEDLRALPLPEAAIVSGAPEPDALTAKVLAALGFEPVTPAVLAHRAGLTIQTLSSILGSLELAGQVRRLLGGSYERIH